MHPGGQSLFLPIFLLVKTICQRSDRLGSGFKVQLAMLRHYEARLLAPLPLSQRFQKQNPS